MGTLATWGEKTTACITAARVSGARGRGARSIPALPEPFCGSMGFQRHVRFQDLPNQGMEKVMLFRIYAVAASFLDC